MGEVDVAETEVSEGRIAKCARKAGRCLSREGKADGASDWEFCR